MSSHQYTKRIFILVLHNGIRIDFNTIVDLNKERSAIRFSLIA